jgi:hypothetical protein
MMPGPKTKEAAQTGGLLDSLFITQRPGSGRRNWSGQKRKRRPTVGAQLLKTWKPFARPPAIAEYMKPP